LEIESLHTFAVIKMR